MSACRFSIDPGGFDADRHPPASDEGATAGSQAFATVLRARTASGRGSEDPGDGPAPGRPAPDETFPDNRSFARLVDETDPGDDDTREVEELIQVMQA